MNAQGLHAAIERTLLQQRPTCVKLQTMRVGHDLWQRYSLLMDSAAGTLTVKIGPRVGTGGEPEGPQPPLLAGRQATIALPCALQLDYLATTEVDILDGPSFGFTPQGDGVAVGFLPWHRAWSHSLVVATALGATVAVLSRDGLAGLAAGTGCALHIGLDQLGFMGLRKAARGRAAAGALRGMVSQHGGHLASGAAALSQHGAGRPPARPTPAGLAGGGTAAAGGIDFATATPRAGLRRRCADGDTRTWRWRPLRQH